MDLVILGSSCNLPAHWAGGARARKNVIAAKISVRPSEGAAEGGCGENSAAPERKPRRLLVQSRTPKKSFVFLLEEKIRRAQKENRKQNFSLWWRALASGGGAASIVGVVFLFKKGSREVYNYSTKTNFFGIDCSARRPRGGRLASQSKIRLCFCRKIPEFAQLKI